MRAATHRPPFHHRLAPLPALLHPPAGCSLSPRLANPPWIPAPCSESGELTESCPGKFRGDGGADALADHEGGVGQRVLLRAVAEAGREAAGRQPSGAEPALRGA